MGENMNGSFYLTLATFVYVSIIFVIFFKKEKIKSFENEIYNLVKSKQTGLKEIKVK